MQSFFFSEMEILQSCVVKSLEKCQESTPANLVESMFKFVRKETPCVNMTSVSLWHSNPCLLLWTFIFEYIIYIILLKHLFVSILDSVFKAN